MKRWHPSAAQTARTVFPYEMFWNTSHALADIRDHRSWVCRAFDARQVCPSSGWGVVALAEADRYPLSALAAAAPTAGSAAPQKPPEFARLHLHFPGLPSPSPKPSPGSSACTLCQLMNGPSSHFAPVRLIQSTSLLVEFRSRKFYAQGP
jgi:hypothetical protein